jgi:hypothetical protein
VIHTSDRRFCRVKGTGPTLSVLRRRSTSRQAVEAVGIRHEQALAAAELPLLDHVHGLDASSELGGRAETLEPEHRPGSTFDGSVILCDEVVQVLRLAQLDGQAAVGPPASEYMSSQ